MHNKFTKDFLTLSLNINTPRRTEYINSLMLNTNRKKIIKRVNERQSILCIYYPGIAPGGYSWIVYKTL